MVPVVPSWFGIVCVFRAYNPSDIFFPHCRVCMCYVVASIFFLTYALTSSLLNKIDINGMHLFDVGSKGLNLPFKKIQLLYIKLTHIIAKNIF
jgi:hypothetical protein